MQTPSWASLCRVPRRVPEVWGLGPALGSQQGLLRGVRHSSADGLRALTAHPGWRGGSPLSLSPPPSPPGPRWGNCHMCRTPLPAGRPPPPPSPSQCVPSEEQSACSTTAPSGVAPWPGARLPQAPVHLCSAGQHHRPLPGPASPTNVASQPGFPQLGGQSPHVLGCFLYLRVGYRRCPGGAACRWRLLPTAGSTGQAPTRALRTAVTRSCWPVGIR